MKKLITSCSMLTLMLGLAILAPATRVHAEDPATDKKEEKKDDKAKTAVKGPRMWGIWAKLTTLSPETKIKIKEIHDKALDEKKAIDNKEEADILALLSDEQKLELQKVKEDEAAAKKAMADKKKDGAKEEPKKEEAKPEEKKDGM